jgi:hypothetical protein
VEAYVFLLRLERSGLPSSTVSVTDGLRSGPLKSRNEASVRYRMRNISAVVKELGGPTLSAYSPAERVGVNVRTRIRDLLTTHPGFQELLEHSSSRRVGLSDPGPRPTLDEALNQLAQLRKRLDDFDRAFEREFIGIGHNHPPESLDAGGLNRDDFVQARDDVQSLEDEAGNVSPNRDIIRQRSNRLLTFGLKVAAWFGGRATKFADSAIAVVATSIALAKADELTLLIQNTVATLWRALF